ncbi:MAG: hypothetical protein H6R10_405 [Rhodocyclaceae bacterium]|nr:hypothetical protein [Rhodocyclaceae bacterium]
MRNILLFVAAAILASSANATLLKQRQHGTQVHGRTSFIAAHRDATARSDGERNIARNSAGVIREGAQIRGNTAITAAQDGATAIAAGRGNVAANEAGVIGGQ